MNDEKSYRQTGQTHTSEASYTPEEERIAEKEAMAMIYGMGGTDILGLDRDPLTTPEGMAMFQAKKEEMLRQLVAKRLRAK